METELTLLELYTRVLTDFKRKHYLFICRTIINLPNVGYYYQMKCLNHFKTQFPSDKQYTDFFNHRLFNRTIKFKHEIDNAEWFKYPEKVVDGELVPFLTLTQSEGFEIRIKFIEAIIEKLKQDETN